MLVPNQYELMSPILTSNIRICEIYEDKYNAEQNLFIRYVNYISATVKDKMCSPNRLIPYNGYPLKYKNNK